MKLAKIILPVMMAFSLSGCSLLSNLLSGGKSNSGNSSNTSTTSQSTNTSSSSSTAITIEQVAADIGTSLGGELEYDSTYGYYNIGYDLSRYTQVYIDKKVNLINNRPRKCNNWISPSKLMSEAISECCT